MAKRKKSAKAKRPTKAQMEKWTSSKGMRFDDPEPKKVADAISLVLDAEEADLRAAEKLRKKRNKKR